MSEWHERPAEIAYLFNPAFCGRLLVIAVNAYVAESGAGVAFPLAFLPLPIVLHEPTRRVLPKTKATSMLIWLQREPHVRVGFADRVRGLMAATREGLLFAAMRGYLRIHDGKVSPGARLGGSPKLDSQSDDYGQCVGRVEFVGRMLARAGPPTTIYASWGIRP